MAMSPERADLHAMVDSIPVRCTRCAPSPSRLLRPGAGRPGTAEAAAAPAESVLADEPVRHLSFVGLFSGPPDLAGRSEEILRAKFASRADTHH